MTLVSPCLLTALSNENKEYSNSGKSSPDAFGLLRLQDPKYYTSSALSVSNSEAAYSGMNYSETMSTGILRRGDTKLTASFQRAGRIICRL